MESAKRVGRRRRAFAPLERVLPGAVYVSGGAYTGLAGITWLRVSAASPRCRRTL